MPVDFLTTEQTESYGRFTGEPDELQLARYFHLDEADKEFIGKSRGDHNRLGIALQIGCVRFLGTFLTDMNHIPSGVRHFTARQLGIRDITVLAEYGQRENTRREHAALIRQHYQYREFAWPWTFRGLAPIFPYTFYHLTHDWFVAADIPVGNDTPVHYADAIRCNVRRPPQGSLPLLTRRASA